MREEESRGSRLSGPILRPGATAGGGGDESE